MQTAPNIKSQPNFETEHSIHAAITYRYLFSEYKPLFENCKLWNYDLFLTKRKK